MVVDIDKSGISSFLSHADLELLFCFSPQYQFCTLDFLKNVFDRKKEEKFRALNVHQRIDRKTPDVLDVVTLS